jgi:hypothetical protein
MVFIDDPYDAGALSDGRRPRQASIACMIVHSNTNRETKFWTGGSDPDATWWATGDGDLPSKVHAAPPQTVSQTAEAQSHVLRLVSMFLRQAIHKCSRNAIYERV